MFHSVHQCSGVVWLICRTQVLMCRWFTEDCITSHCGLSAFSDSAVWKSLIEFHSCHIRRAQNNHHNQCLPLLPPPSPQSVPSWFKGISQFVIHVALLILGLALSVSLASSDIVLNSQSCLLPYLSLCCFCAHYFSHTSALAAREPHVWRMKLVSSQYNQSRQCRAKGFVRKKKKMINVNIDICCLFCCVFITYYPRFFKFLHGCW